MMLKRMRNLRVFLVLMAVSVPGVVLASGPAFNDTTQRPLAPDANGNVGIGTTTPQGGFVVTNGNVGIGTWAPVQLLDVKGTTRVANFIMSGQSPANGYVLSATDSAGDTTWIPSTVGGGWTVVGTNTYLTTPSNNVGVGTTTPQGAFVITNGNVGIGTWTAGGSLIVAIGNVGIGTTVPGQVLDVAGSIRTRGTNSDYFGDDNKASITASAATAGGIKFLTNNTENMRIANGGNVGIGTTVPVLRLQITSGDVLVDNAHGFSSLTSAGLARFLISSTASDNLMIGNIGWNAITFFPGASEVMRITGGNVGIGSTAPGQTLDVAGNVRLTASTPTLTFGTASNNVAAIISLISENTYKNWQITSSQITNGALQFVPSTATGGTTFTTPAMTIDTNSNVGIGTTTPIFPLDAFSAVDRAIQATRSNTATDASSSLGATLRIVNSDTTTNNFEGIDFGTFDSSATVRAVAFIKTVNTARAAGSVTGDLAFTTVNAGTAAEAMRITSAGNVGIGFTAPTNKLVVNDATAQEQAAFYGYSVVGARTNTDSGSIRVGNNNSNYGRIDYSSAGITNFTFDNTYDNALAATQFRMRTGGTPVTAMTILGSGNVGIGTIGPLAPLHILSSAAASTSGQVGLIVSATNAGGTVGSGPYIRFDNGGGNVEIGRIGSFAESSGNAFMSFYTYNSSLSEKMRISAAGNVGIGTTTPNSILEITRDGGTANYGSTTVADQGLTITGKSSTNPVGITFGGSPANSYAGIYGVFTSGSSNTAGDIAIALRANTGDSTFTEAMRIKQSGNVGIGTATPQALLHVYSTGGETVRIQSDAPQLRLQQSSANGALYQNWYTSGGTRRGFFGFTAPSSSVFKLTNEESGAIDITAHTLGVELAADGTSWSSLSDERLKDILGPIKNATDKLLDLRTVYYKFKTDENTTRRLGLIAQDVRKVFPEIVDTGSDGYLKLRYTELIPPIIKSVQELDAQMQELAKENKDLKARVEQLERKIASSLRSSQ